MKAILRSSFNLPLWVQLWVVVWLMPVNVATLFFTDWTYGPLVAGLANFGMILNIPIIFYDRGISKLMALPHLLLWTPLVVICAVALTGNTDLGGARPFIWVLMVTNIISLIFDYPDFLKWLRGDRAIA